MPVPLIPPLPTAPSRLQAAPNYAVTADIWAAAIGPWTEKVNTLGNYVEQRAFDSNSSANEAANSALDANSAAQRAEAVDTNVSTQVLAAQAAANNAAASATAAESAQGSIGNLALIHSLTIGMMRRF